MGSGFSCNREAAVPVSSPQAKAGGCPAPVPQPGAAHGPAPSTATTLPVTAGSGRVLPQPARVSSESGRIPSGSGSRSGWTPPESGGAAAAGSAGAAAGSRVPSGRSARSEPADPKMGPNAAATIPTITTIASGGGSGGGGVRRLPHIGGLAVSLAYLVDFAERNVPPSQPTWAVVDQLIKPHTLKDTIRYVDLPHVFRHTLPPGRSDYYFVSHAWGRPFWEMVGLCAHYLRGAVAADTYVWCDIFIINQHPGQQQADDLQQLRLAVSDAAATLVCTDAAGAPFERIWCLFEMWTTLTVDVASGGGEEGRSSNSGSGEEGRPTAHANGGGGGGGGGGPVRSRSQSMVVLTTGLSAAQRAKLYSQIDASTAKATVASDKERILADIAASSGGIAAFNAAMRCALLLRPLDYEGELAGLAEAAAPMNRGSAQAAAGGAAAAPGGRHVQPQEWDFSALDAWLALPPSHKHHRALALLGGPGTGKSSAAAAAMRRMLVAGAAAAPAGGGSGGDREAAGGQAGTGGGLGLPVAAHFCRANDLQALDPLAAMRTLAYQLSQLFPRHLQGYYAFDLAKSGRGSEGGGSGGGDSSSVALQIIAGMAAAEGGGGGGGSGAAAGSSGGDGGDPVAAAFTALLQRPLELLWKSYEDAVQAAEAAAEGDGGGDGGGDGTAAAMAPPLPPSPPRLVLLLDAVDEGDGGAVGGSHENAMLLLLQEHFPRLPAFVRLVVTARPLPHIRALLTHKFDPRVICPDDLRPPSAACAAALATRLTARPALAAALLLPGATVSDGAVGPLAERLWKASKGWMLFLRLAADVLEATAAAAAAGTATTVSTPATASRQTSKSSEQAATSAVSPPQQLPPPLQQPPPQQLPPLQQPHLAAVVEELTAVAAAADPPSLYSLYMRRVVAPAVTVAAGAAGASAAVVPERPTAEQLVFLLEVLGAAREPLYLSQLQDLGLPAVSSGTKASSGGGGDAAAALRLGCLVNVRGYKLHGIHRSLFEWLAAGGADEMPRLLAGDANKARTGSGTGTSSSAGSSSSSSSSGGGGLHHGHAALAAMTLRDVSAARASQAAGGGGGGGARGPRGPDSYSLQHAAAHVLEAAAARTAAGDEEGALALLRTLFLDFYYWRCVYQDGSAASVALAALLRHESIFAAAAAAATTPGAPPPAAATAAATVPLSPAALAGRRGGGGGTAAALAADAARWLQSYHGSLLRFPEAVLQTALTLPATSPIRAAALAALAPPRPLPSAAPASSASGAAPTSTSTASRPTSASGVGVAAAAASSPSPSRRASTSTSTAATPAAPSPTSRPPSRPASCSGAVRPTSASPPAAAPPAAAAQLGGTSWPAAFPLSNPPPDWDACLLAVDSRGVTRGLAWVPEPGLVVTACDDRRVHLLSPVTGGQVGLMEGHTDRVYCVALRPETNPKSKPTAAATQPGAGTQAAEAAVVVVASGSLDGRIALWDGGSRMQLQLLEPGEDEAEKAAEDTGAEGGQVISFGFSVVEERPTGRSANGSVDCLAFSPDGAWLAAGTSDGSIPLWQVLDHEGDGAAGGTSGGGAVSVRAVKLWVCPQAHKEAVAGLTFLHLTESLGGAGPGTCGRKSVRSVSGGGGGGAPPGLPTLVLASCSEDGSIHLWDPRVGTCADGASAGSGGGGVMVVSEPLRTLRADSEAQVLYEATGLQPQLQQPTTTSSDPWFIADVPTPAAGQAGPTVSGGGSESGDSRRLDAAGVAVVPPPPPSLPPMLAGVAEDVEGRQSRASYKASEHYCVAAGPGLPSGCLLVGSGSGPVCVWDVASGMLRERLRGHVDAVRCLALQHGGPHFASGSGDCTVRLWRHLPTTDPQGWTASLQAARQLARDDAAAAEAARIAAAAEVEAKRRAQMETDQSISRVDAPDTEAAEQEEEEEEERSPPAPRVCRRPCQWQCVAVLRGHTRLVTSLVFLTSAASVAAAAVALEPGCKPGLGGSRSGSESARSGRQGAVGPRACRLASASVDFSVRIWQVDLEAPKPEAPGGGHGGGGGATRPVGHEGFSVNTVAVSPDTRLVATGADDFQVCVWDGASGQHRRTLRCFHGRVRAVAFSRDSRRMAAAADDGGVFIFDISGDDEFSTIGWCTGHAKAATGVAFSPDGFSLASSSEDGTARIWAVRGFQTALLEGHPSGATAVAWAEEGSLVATGAARGDPGVQLWDARMGMRLNTLRYHVADVAFLAFGSAIEPPPPPSPSTPPPPPRARSRPSSSGSVSANAAAVAAADDPSSPPQPQPRRHVLLMSLDVRGLACVWDVWDGGLLHCIEHVQGADLTGSKLMWMQARAMHYADMQELLQRPPPEAANDGYNAGHDSGGGRQQQRRRRRPQLTTALAALYPPGEAVDVAAAGAGLSRLVAVTDKQRLYIFRPLEVP